MFSGLDVSEFRSTWTPAICERSAGVDRTHNLANKNPSLKARSLNLRTRIQMLPSGQSLELARRLREDSVEDGY